MQWLIVTSATYRESSMGDAYLMKLRYPETLTKTEVREKVWEDSIKPLSAPHQVNFDSTPAQTRASQD